MKQENTYLFYRMHEGREVFYPVTYPDDRAACAGAELNHGTTKVQDRYGKVVWNQAYAS